MQTIGIVIPMVKFTRSYAIFTEEILLDDKFDD